MADWSNDIEKYRKGELSAAQMHELEKKALSDPFLADALEGSEQITDEQFSNDINEINTHITASKKSSLWTPLRIAAGVLIILGVSSVMYFLSNENPVAQLAEQAQPASSSVPESTNEQKDSTLKKPDDHLVALNESKKKEKQDEVASKNQPLTTAPLALSDKIATSTADDFAPVEEERDITEVKTEAEAVQSLDSKDESKAAGKAQRLETVDSIFEKRKAITSDRNLARSKKSSTPSVSGASIDQLHQVISGQVTSAEDSQPLPGVNVLIKGTSVGTITDVEGNYTIEIPDQKNAQLVFSFIGVQTIEEPVKDQKAVNVQLKNDVSQLSEVVVVGYGSIDDSPPTNFPTAVLAEPAGGRKAFNKYLETNLHYPDQAIESKIEGRVTIQFIVKTDGALDGFKVVKGIGGGCEEEVIRLIKIGPKWTPSLQNEKPIDSRMRVRMRFKLPR